VKAFAAAAATAALLTGCGGETALAPPDYEPGYSGTVEDVSGGGTVLVKAEGDTCGIWVTPTDRVQVLRRTGATYEEAEWADLQAGRSVELWIPGPIAESCPLQGEAEAAVLVDGAPATP
jgi:hypothetical protein